MAYTSQSYYSVEGPWCMHIHYIKKWQLEPGHLDRGRGGGVLSYLFLSKETIFLINDKKVRL